MSGDVRSLEEVIADAYHAYYDLTMDDELRKQIAAAVREWCLAPQQIERAQVGAWEHSPFSFDDSREVARAALQAVMGDTPRSGIISVPGELSADEVQELRAQWNATGETQ